MTSRRLGITAALTVGPIAAWRFAQAYRARAGYPHRHAPEYDPADLGLAFETVQIPSEGVPLPPTEPEWYDGEDVYTIYRPDDDAESLA